MITEDYVSFETVKLLKEKGFDEATYHDYDEKGRRWFQEVLVCHNSQGGIACPTLQMAMKWLREEHNIHIEIGFDGMGYFPVCISVSTNEPIPYKPMHGKPFTYEEACEAAIKYCLENLI